MIMSKNLTISELAKQSGGVSLRTIRHYEEIGLLQHAELTPGGHRLYGLDAVLTMKKVRLLQEAGMSLEEIGKLLSTLETKPTARKEKTQAHIQTIMDVRESLIARRQEIETMIVSLDSLKEDEQRCAGCNPPDCKACGRLKKWTEFGL